MDDDQIIQEPMEADPTKPKRRGGAGIRIDQWERLISAFRLKPGNVAHAARVVGVMHKTARKAWFRGWNSPEWAREPIKEMFAREELEARAKLRDEELRKTKEAAKLREEKAKGQLDAREERYREGYAIRAAMTATVANLVSSANLSKARTQLTKVVGEAIVTDAINGKVEWPAAVALVERLGKLDAQTINSLATVMDCVRKHLGDSKDHLGAMAHPPEAPGISLVEEMGGVDELRQAVLDLAADVMSPSALRLVEAQAAREMKN